jgi:hypothetical protein
MMRRFIVSLFVLLVAAAIVIQPAAAQEHVQKWSLYSGYSYFNTPSKDLEQHGFNINLARNTHWRWLSIGGDFSHASGSSSQIQGVPVSLAPFVPAPYLPLLSGVQLKVPYDATSTIFAAGTQVEWRHKRITPFARPYLGMFHMNVQGDPNQVIPASGISPAQFQALMASLNIPQATLKKALQLNATMLGYGAGGGMDLNFTDAYALRFTADFIRTPFFGQRQNNVRIAAGLVHRFGGEVGRSSK